MTFDPESKSEVPVLPAQVVKPPRSRWQFSLRMILLGTAAVGVWTAHLVNQRENRGLESRIKAMRPLARELVVKDPNQIAVVKREELWYDENEWEVYLPAGNFQLSLATQQIDQSDLAPVNKSVSLPAGQFILAITQEKLDAGWRVRVTKDGQEILMVEEPKEWDPASGSSGGGDFAIANQMDAQKPVVLFRRRFTRPISPTSSQTPTVPCEGVLLWIEPAK